MIDIGNTCDYQVSLISLSGSNTAVGRIIDLLGADTNCIGWVAATALSGLAPIFIQTADVTTSGTFSDPTSGLWEGGGLPDGVASGGIFWANSGLYASGYNSPSSPLNDGPLMCSGGIQFFHFQKPHRYARLNLSGGAIGAEILMAGFISQKKVTGSGHGFSFLPGSGSLSV